MAIRTILHYPDPGLKVRAREVREFDAELKTLVSDMAETMYAAPGIGLAATQVGVPLRVLVIDLTEEKNHLRVFVNPKILARDGIEEREEGCLSVPGIYEKVTRAAHVRVQAVDTDGKSFTVDADGLLAVCLQHEIDHLDGKVFVEYLSRLKQGRIREKLRKRVKETM